MNALFLPIALAAGLTVSAGNLDLEVSGVGEIPSWAFADESDVVTQVCTRVTWELAQE